MYSGITKIFIGNLSDAYLRNLYGQKEQLEKKKFQ